MLAEAPRRLFEEPTVFAWALPGDIWALIFALANKDGNFACRVAHFSKELARAACVHEDNTLPAAVPAAVPRSGAVVAACRRSQVKVDIDLFGSDGSDSDDDV